MAVVVTASAPNVVAAQGQPAPAAPVSQTPVPQQPAPQQPPVPAAPPVPGTVACPAPVPPATIPARSFTATRGMLFHQVIPARVADFDRFLAKSEAKRS